MLEPVITEHKPVKRAWRRWVLILLLSLGVLLVIISTVQLSWRTTRFPLADGKTYLSVQVPLSWKAHLSSESKSIIVISPPQPTGFVQWWDEHVLKIRMREWDLEEIVILSNEREAASAASGSKELETVMQTLTDSYRRGYGKVKTARFTQDSMEGFTLEATSYYGNLGRDTNINFVMFCRYDPIRHQRLMITAQMRANPHNYPLLKPTMDEIIRRLRLVQK